MSAFRRPRPRVLFVCRGSTRDGLGHVIRSRTVALAMSAHAAVRLVVIGDEVVEGLLIGRNLEWDVVADDASAAAAADAFQPDIVFWDLLQIDDAAYRRISAGRTAASICPIFSHQHAVDLVFHRTDRVGDADTRDWAGELRAGLRYSVVRDEVTRITETAFAANLRQQTLSVAVSMGGGDADNKTLAVLQAMRFLPRRMLLWVLLGEGYGHSYEALVDCVKQNPQHEIILAKTNDSMWRVLGACSVAILAGGTTTYEAAAAGLPSINIFDHESQTFLVEELVEYGACLSAGAPTQPAILEAVAMLVRLEDRREELMAMHRRCRGLIDGRGAHRIASETLAFHRAKSAEGLQRRAAS